MPALPSLPGRRGRGRDAPELVCRAVQLIIGGALDEAGEAAVGARLGMSARHLRRLFREHLGATPDQLARSRRAHFARRLLDDSDLPVADVAFASGFGSLRQFNREMRQVFRATPRELRERRRRGDRLAADGGLALRMPFTAPYDWDAVAGFLAERAVPGVESVEAGVYRRTITLDGAPGTLEVGPGGADHLLLRAHLPHWEGVIHVVERAARLVGVDADPAPALERLAADATLGRLVAARPGVRVPGAWGPFEVAVHAVLRQELDASRARRGLGALVAAHGTPVPGLSHGLTHAFPSAGVLAEVPAGDLGPSGRAVSALARAVVSGPCSSTAARHRRHWWRRCSRCRAWGPTPPTTSPCGWARATRSRRRTRRCWTGCGDAGSSTGTRPRRGVPGARWPRCTCSPRPGEVSRGTVPRLGSHAGAVRPPSRSLSSPYPASMSAVTGTDTAATMRRSAVARSRPPASATPAAHDSPALVVAIAAAPAASIATAEAGSQAFGSTRGGRSCRACSRAAR
ncbi:hypothetical protein GCM10009678_06550 [Actinomadura kijaniata]|uniref:AraC-like DNA-binding protein n=1 Tax=Actinomadura namibiensis TaxID=182080 RepID=A0A7W3QKG3_ACTNM|nr:AraC-like DNA-binding protein [Actinomadura namibiensis]